VEDFAEFGMLMQNESCSRWIGRSAGDGKPVTPNAFGAQRGAFGTCGRHRSTERPIHLGAAWK